MALMHVDSGFDFDLDVRFEPVTLSDPAGRACATPGSDNATSSCTTCTSGPDAPVQGPR
jgi:hypothetical protein